MKYLIAMSLLIASSALAAEDLVIQRETAYAPGQEIYTVKSSGYGLSRGTYIKQPRSDIDDVYAREFRTKEYFTHVLVTDADYAAIAPRKNNLNCAEMRNEIFLKIKASLSKDLSAPSKSTYLTNLRMDCVTLSQNLEVTERVAESANYGFYVNSAKVLSILPYNGWFDCRKNHNNAAYAGEFFECKEIAQMININ